MVTRKELVASGRSRAQIQVATASGSLERIDRTRYALPDADPQVVAAARSGATLTCLSALRLHGVDTGPLSGLHLRRHRYADNNRHQLPGRSCRLPGFEFDVSCVVDPLDKALLAALRNHPPEAALIVLDSILHARLRTRAELEPVVQHAGRYAVDLLSRADSRSESPLESIVRHRLMGQRIRFGVQVRLQHIGRVDFLIGRRLIVETDGREFHDPGLGEEAARTFEEDRRRDAEAARQGFSVIRLTWDGVTKHWDHALSSILAVVRSDGHRRPPARLPLPQGVTV